MARAGVYLPPGWPASVHPPGSEGFARTAQAWLYDHCPSDFRAYEVLRRHPPMLARMAVEQLTAATEACRTGYRTARAESADASPESVDALLAAYEREGRRLAAATRAAELIRRALAGESFTEPL